MAGSFGIPSSRVAWGARQTLATGKLMAMGHIEAPAVVAVGQPAPEITLETEAGPLSLASFRGRILVLYFYPRDMTPGCTNEACDFRDAYGEFQRLGATVVGVSPDTLESHARFVAKHQLPFVLASDPEGVAAQAFGAWKEKTLYGKKTMGVERSTFVIDREGIVRGIFRRVKVPGHVMAVLDLVRRL